MIRNSLSMRVALETGAVSGALALPAAWLAGPAAGLGVLAGALLAIGNFLVLARRTVDALHAPGASSAAWGLASALRLLVLALACAVLFRLGAIHPVALLVGLTVLPCDLIVHGLRTAREGA